MRTVTTLSFFLLLGAISCNNSRHEKKSTLKDFSLDSVNLELTNSKEKSEDSVQHRSRDTLQIKHMIEQYRKGFESTNAIDTTINGSYGSIYVSPEFDLKVVDTLSESDFESYQSGAAHTLSNEMILSSNTDSAFTLETASHTITFSQSFEMGSEHYFTSVGKIPELGTYTFIECLGSGGKGMCAFWLLDSSSNRLMHINSDYDGGYEKAMVSKDKTRLLCIANDPFERGGATIKIMHIDMDKASYQLRHFLHFETKGLRIAECHFLDNERIAIKAYQNYPCFYKATIDSNYTISYHPDGIDCDPLYLVLRVAKAR